MAAAAGGNKARLPFIGGFIRVPRRQVELDAAAILARTGLAGFVGTRAAPRIRANMEPRRRITARGAGASKVEQPRLAVAAGGGTLRRRPAILDQLEQRELLGLPRGGDLSAPQRDDSRQR
jgi:hypothetical protein